MLHHTPNAYVLFDQKKMTLQLDKSNIAAELYVQFTKEKLDERTTRFVIWIHPKQDIVIKAVSLDFSIPFTENDTFFCNGFQTWTESKHYNFKQKLDNLMPFSRLLMKNCGDYHLNIVKPFRKKGALHAWTYSQLTTRQQNIFIGSLNETNGFTLIGADLKKQQISVRKDIENLHLSHSFCALDVLVIENAPPPVSSQIFDVYFKQYYKNTEIQPAHTHPMTGWTSWYLHYQNISEAILRKNLTAFETKNLPIDVFQIDDGWQTAVGDWLSIDEKKFPNGLKNLAIDIKKTALAGLWISPFIVASNSRIFAEKPHWLLRDAAGKLVKAGFAPHWSGWEKPFFYALDFYNKDVQDYLAAVFHTALQKWGFDMLKLDFLYAVCIEPRPNKTRGQIMHDAMQFIRQHCGEKVVLACGVPLASAFGLVEFARIGADIHLRWEHKLLRAFKHRERVSTLVALRTAVGRWQLNGRAFASDTDVFLLRKENIHLSDDEKYTVFVLNCLLGKLLFTSDDVDLYDEKTMNLYKKIFDFKDSIVETVVEFPNDFISIKGTLRDQKFEVKSNLADHAQQDLNPHETIFSII